jgi:hypothetical protein
MNVKIKILSFELSISPFFSSEVWKKILGANGCFLVQWAKIFLKILLNRLPTDQKLTGNFDSGGIRECF